MSYDSIIDRLLHLIAFNRKLVRKLGIFVKKFWRIAIGVPGIVFVFVGIGWLIAPEMAGAQLGMTLSNGVGLSSQVGDFASFFLTLGTCMLLGLRTTNRPWFYAAIMLLGFAALGRMFAWAFHDAALALDMIALEVLLAVLLYFASENLAATK